MPRYLDTDTWSRKGAFEFFRDFDNPYVNITAPLAAGSLLDVCKAEALPFSLSALYLALRAANETEPFRYRLENGRVLVHDVLHGSSTALVGEDQLVFLYFANSPDFATFRANADAARQRAQADPSILDARAQQTDVIHFSTLPWIAFTSLSHARNWRQEDSIPKVTFGRYERHGERVTMPVSVEVHHALMDGLHIGRFFERFQALLESPEAVLLSAP